jgi:hypothetical protein
MCGAIQQHGNTSSFSVPASRQKQGSTPVRQYTSKAVRPHGSTVLLGQQGSEASLWLDKSIARTLHLSVSHLRGSIAAAARATLSAVKGSPALLNMVLMAPRNLAGSQKSSNLQVEQEQHFFC